MNGRPGVVVSGNVPKFVYILLINELLFVFIPGGAGPYFTNMTAVEFFDLATGKWISLPNLGRGR
jgi:hypothetical protein